MWLIDCKTFRLEYFVDQHQAPPYAILSHKWGGDELLFAQLKAPDGAEKAQRNDKIRLTCEEALKNVPPLRYAWIDTCCIDKSSSAELSEAINAMYSYYHAADRCYAFLTDVNSQDDKIEDWLPQFRQSIWFLRGWTLQELLAPKEIMFFEKRWEFLGSRSSLHETISDITSVDAEALNGFDPSRTFLDVSGSRSELQTFSVAKRMSWAANRETTRLEDEAYCLLGIFDVHMPLLYGEGRRSFIRLQEEIIKRSTDQSIFAWMAPPDDTSFNESELLARSPRCFAHCKDIVSYLGAPESFQITNAGLEGSFLLDGARLKTTSGPGYDISRAHHAILNCKLAQDHGNVIALPLHSPHNSWEDRTGDGRAVYSIDPKKGLGSGGLFSSLPFLHSTQGFGRVRRVSLVRTSDFEKQPIVIRPVALFNKPFADLVVKLALRSSDPELNMIDCLPRETWTRQNDAWATVVRAGTRVNGGFKIGKKASKGDEISICINVSASSDGKRPKMRMALASWPLSLEVELHRLSKSSPQLEEVRNGTRSQLLSKRHGLCLRLSMMSIWRRL